MAEPKLTIKEASAYTGMPTGTISYAAKCDPPRLRSFKAGQFGPFWFEKADLDRWLSEMETAPAPSPTKKRRRRATAGR
ncbi:hypothetical protein [Pseudonocardia sp.]|uniref:hypothetical protein n=1 Tax=Pseudonocardia sp. TaxID=60912 RepID=UPI002605FB2B|nr:hypothetical protein [Pseudonocardia sp.]